MMVGNEKPKWQNTFTTLGCSGEYSLGSLIAFIFHS